MAAGDMALMILINATDFASEVMLGVADTFDSALSSMIDSVTAFNASLSSMDASFSGLDAGASSADAALSSLDATASSADSSLASVETALSALDGAAASAGGALESLESAVVSADASLSSIETAASSADAALTGMEAGASSADAALSSIEGAASGVDAALSSIEASAAGVDGALATIENAAGAVDAAMSSIEASASGADSALSSIDGAATGAEGALGGIEGTAAGMQASIDALTGAIAALTASIGELAGSAAAADGALASEAATADAAAASMQGLAASQKLASGMGNLLSNLKMPALLAGAALLGIGAASIKMAGDFQSSLTTLQTGAGELSQNMGIVRQGILNLAQSTGTSTSQLVQAMYMIDSANIHGAASLEVLRVAAQGAQVGNAQLETVARAVTGVLTNYHMQANQAAQAMNALTVTVGDGQTHLQDLASSMGNILPLAASLGVSFPQIAGALAVMTNHQMSAQRASMNLANALRSLAAPNATATKAMTGVGLSATQLSNTLTHQGLQQALVLIEQHLNSKFPQGSAAWIAAAKQIMGGAAGLNVLLMLGGKNMSSYEGNIKNISAAMQHGGNSVQGWSKVQGDFNTQINQAKAVVEVFMIQLGTQLAPVFGRLVAQVVPLLKNFAAWENQTHFIQNAISGLVTVIGALITGGAGILSFFAQNHVALTILGLTLVAVAGAIVGALIPAFIGWVAAMWAGVPAAIALVTPLLPFILIGAAVALAIVGIILAIQHWGQIVTWLKGVWASFSAWFGSAMSAIGTFFHNVWNGIENFFVGVWNHIVSFAKAAWNIIVNVVKVAAMVLLAVIIGPIGLLVLYIVTHWAQVKTFLTSIWNGIVSLAKSIWNNIVGAISGAIKTIVSWFLWLFNHNYYFHNLVVGILTVFNNAKSFLTNIWQTIVTWVVDRWTYLKTMAEVYFMFIYVTIQQKIQQVQQFITNIWTTIVTWITTQWTLLKLRAEIYFLMIYVTIQQKILQVQSFLTGILNAIVAFFTSRWNNLVANTTALWSRISTIFSSAWNTYIAGPLGSLWNSIWTTVTGWGSKIWQAGQNLISMLAQGIASGAGMIWNAVKGIAGQIWSALGFHSPAEKGPGADADKWMPNLINMLSAGLIAGAPQIHRAALQVAGALTPLSGNTSSNGRAFALSGANGTALALSGGGNQTIVIQMQPQDINLDGQKVGTAVSKVQASQVRRIGGYRNG